MQWEAGWGRREVRRELKGRTTGGLGGVASRLGKNHFFVNSEILGLQIWRKKNPVNYDKLELWQNSVNQIFNPHAFLFFLLTGATWYYHAIYLVFTYVLSFTGCEYDIFEVISNLHRQGYNFGGKFDKFSGKPFRKLNSAEFMEFIFSKSGGQRES